MDLNAALQKRRSIRKYAPQGRVSREQIEELLKAAALAPSWKNSQTARYYVITSPEMAEEIRETCLPEFNRKNSANAPVLIVTAYVKNHSGFDRDGSPCNEVGNGWGAYDLGLHNGNLILKAVDLGLDTLIMGIRDGEALRKRLNIDENQEIVSVIAVGVRAVDPEMPARKSLEEIARFY